MKKYEKYKDSGIEWIGEIPEHWEVKRLKSLARVQTGGTPKIQGANKDYFFEGSINWFTPGDFNNDGVLTDSTRKVNQSAVLDNEVEVFPEKSVYLVCIGATLGKVGICSVAGTANQQINIIVFDNNLIIPDFGFYYILGNNEMILNEADYTTLPIFNQSKTKNLSIVLPPPPEQTAIATYLDRKTTEIDQLIEAKKRLIELYHEEKTAIINQAVTKGINPNAKMKDSGIEWLGEIPEHWEVKRIKQLVSKVGSGVTPSGGASVYQTSGIPLLRSQNIHFDGLKLDDVAYISEDIHNDMSNSKVNAGDVLINITGASIGRTFYVEEWLGEANVNQHVCIIRPKKQISSVYLYYLLRSNIGQEQIRQEQTGSGREGLTFEAIKKFVIPFVEIEEQQSIVHHIVTECSRIDTKIERTQRLIELLAEYRTALISEVVTGKVKVV